MPDLEFRQFFKKIIPVKVLIIFFLFTAGIITVGVIFYNSQKESIYTEQENNLKAIATLKIGQIISWKNERQGDAVAIKDNLSVAWSVKNYLSGIDRAKLHGWLIKWINSVLIDYDYRDVILLAPSLKVILSALPSDSTYIEPVVNDIKRSLSTRKIVFTDFYKSKPANQIYLDIIVPLPDPDDDLQTVGIIILRVDPGKYIFPVVQTWPTQSGSAETLIFKKVNDSVLYINELRHWRNTAMNLKFPVKDSRLLASYAAKGLYGMHEGVDYRKVPVIGYVSNIPGTSWFIVAKIDKVEIERPLKRVFIFTLFTVILLILVNALLMGYWIWSQRIRSVIEELENERIARESAEKLFKTEELYRRLFDNMLNGFAYCRMIFENGKPSDFIYLNVNIAFEAQTGLKNVEGKKVSEIIPGITETDKELIQRYGRVAITGTPESFEIYVEALKMWFSISVYSPEKEYFVAVFDVITDRKIAEQKLKYQAYLLENVSDAIIATDENYSITLWNRSAELLYGWTAGEVLGQNGIQIIKTGWADAKAEQMRKRISESGQWFGEAVQERKDGTRFPVEVSSYVVHNMEGQISGYVSVIRDISERKKKEEILRESELRFRSTLDNMLEGCQMLDFDWNYLYINDTADVHNRRPKEELLGRRYMDMWPGIEETEVFRRIKKCLVERIPDQMENKFIYPDGVTGWFDLRLQPVREGIFILSIDITERKHTEIALAESEERFRSMYENVTIGMYRTTKDGKILMANPTMVKMMGFGSFEELASRNLEDEGYEPGYPRTRFHDIMEKDGLITGLESAWYKKDGTVLHLRESARAVRDKNGEIMFYDGTVEDITERKKQEDEIRRLNEELEMKVIERTSQLEDAIKELEAFSYSVSHDLRAPLRAVHGYTNILLEDYKGKLDDEGKRICGIISSSATQMGELIDDLLNFSRIGRSSMNPSVLDMRLIVTSLTGEFLPYNKKREPKFIIGRLHKATGDPNLIRHVWSNLISNAVKYSSNEDNPEIRIGSGIKNGVVTYYIKDNGVGFDMQYKHKLFGVFQRLHSESEFEGNGVGLAIVQRIILRHGGNVWAEGEIGKGATFYFSLHADGND